MCTTFHPALAPEFAMKIGRAATLEGLWPRDWQEFADRADLGFRMVRRVVQELAAGVIDAIPMALGSLAGQGLDEEVLGRLGTQVRARAERCMAGI
jgi:hypothetical protein